MRRLASILALVLGLTLLAAPPASAAVAAHAENRASGSAAGLTTLIEIEARLSEEAVRENAALGYDFASDDAVAARAGATTVGAGRTIVTTRSGTSVAIPEGWVARTADNGKGIVYQRPGAQGNADMIRIMDPTSRYPSGYVRYYNQHGQPLDVLGKPGGRDTTHIPLDYQGPIPGWPK